LFGNRHVADADDTEATDYDRAKVFCSKPARQARGRSKRSVPPPAVPVEPVDIDDLDALLAEHASLLAEHASQVLFATIWIPVTLNPVTSFKLYHLRESSLHIDF
jgi:hypothetical protein